MSFVAAAIVGGGALIGGIVASQGAQSAADTQAGAALNAQNISQNEFNTITAQNAPYMQSGYGALSALDYALGISPQTASGAPVSSGSGTSGGSTLPGYDPSSGFQVNPSGGVTQLLSGGTGGTASASGGAPAGANNAQQLPPGVVGVQNGQFIMANGKPIMSGLTPKPGVAYVNSAGVPVPGTGQQATAGQGMPAAGGGASTGQTAGLGYGSLLAPFTAQNFQQLSPAYNFQLQQGGQGVLNADASGQGALSGSSYKDLMSFNQNLANTSFNNAFNQYQTQQGNIYSRLAGIAQIGQSSANNTGQQGTALAGQAAQSATNVGTALAAGQVGSANAISGAISSAAPWLSYGGGSSGSTGSEYNPEEWASSGP